MEELLKDQKEEEERMVQSQEHDGKSVGQDSQYLGNQDQVDLTMEISTRQDEFQLELFKDQKEKIEKKAVMQSQEHDGKSGLPQSENLDSDPFPLDDNEDDFLMEECQCQDEIFIDEFV